MQMLSHHSLNVIRFNKVLLDIQYVLSVSVSKVKKPTPIKNFLQIQENQIESIMSLTFVLQHLILHHIEFILF